MCKETARKDRKVLLINTTIYNEPFMFFSNGFPVVIYWLSFCCEIEKKKALSNLAIEINYFIFLLFTILKTRKSIIPPAIYILPDLSNAIPAGS